MRAKRRTGGNLTAGVFRTKRSSGHACSMVRWCLLLAAACPMALATGCAAEHPRHPAQPGLLLPAWHYRLAATEAVFSEQYAHQGKLLVIEHNGPSLYS